MSRLGDEKAAGIVDQQLVQLRRDRIDDAEAGRRGGDNGDNGGERRLPVASAEMQVGRIDLPRLAHGRVDDGVRAAAERRQAGAGDQLFQLALLERQRNQADPIDAQVRRRDLGRTGCIEIAMAARGAEQVRQVGGDGRHGRLAFRFVVTPAYTGMP